MEYFSNIFKQYIKKGRNDEKIYELIKRAFSNNLEELNGLELLSDYLYIRTDIDFSNNEELERAFTVLSIPVVMEYRRINYEKEKGKYDIFKQDRVPLFLIRDAEFYNPYENKWIRYYKYGCYRIGNEEFESDGEDLDSFFKRIGLEYINGKHQSDLRIEENVKRKMEAEKKVEKNLK